MEMQGGCNLCFAARDEPYRTIFRNESVVAIVNFEPIKKGHLMVLPLRHVQNLEELHPKEAAAFLQALDRCLHILERYSEEPPMCFVNGWEHRTQPHLHAHVLPSKESLRGLFAATEQRSRRVRSTEEELTAMAEEIRSLL